MITEVICCRDFPSQSVLRIIGVSTEEQTRQKNEAKVRH